jgi:hypothetical protein
MYVAAAWLMPLAVLSQIGLALFGVPLAIHGTLGAMIGFLALFLTRRALAAGAAHSQRILATALVALVGLQPCLIALRSVLPAIAAVHEVNAFVILAVACALALDADEAQTAPHARSHVSTSRLDS